MSPFSVFYRILCIFKWSEAGDCEGDKRNSFTVTFLKVVSVSTASHKIFETKRCSSQFV